jgi:tRNA threonylcarbamoyladenosine biosynthesis protein TsaE
MKELILQNDEATNKLGKDIAREIKLADASSIEIHLEGDLGAGKTFLSRSIIKNCGWNDLVKSPTYTLCEEYDLGKYLFLHIDLYRTNEAQDIDIFDLNRQTDSKKIVLIEWPERLKQKREFDLKLNFNHLINGRKINIEASSDVFSNWLKSYE